MTSTSESLKNIHLIGNLNFNLKEYIMAVIIGIIIFLVILGIGFVYDALTWGLVLYKFWGWFVLPVFITLPTITFVQALGLMFVISLFKSNFSGENIKDEFKKNNYTQPIQILLTPWFILFFGWLAYNIWITP